MSAYLAADLKQHLEPAYAKSQMRDEWHRLNAPPQSH